MSDATLKASLRQTLTYINAYDVELLHAIETDFKAALQGLHEENKCEEIQQNRPVLENKPPEITAPPPASPTKRPSESLLKAKAPASQIELTTLPNWHFQLPIIAATIATILLFIFR